MLRHSNKFPSATLAIIFKKEKKKIRMFTRPTKINDRKPGSRKYILRHLSFRVGKISKKVFMVKIA